MAATDFLAMGIIHAAYEREVSVPRDLSIVGFDDIPIAGGRRSEPHHGENADHENRGWQAWSWRWATSPRIGLRRTASSSNRS